MKRFTGHTEEWGTFLDVKHWPEIKNPQKHAGRRVVIDSVTDGYNPQEIKICFNFLDEVEIPAPRQSVTLEQTYGRRKTA